MITSIKKFPKAQTQQFTGCAESVSMQPAQFSRDGTDIHDLSFQTGSLSRFSPILSRKFQYVKEVNRHENPVTFDRYCGRGGRNLAKPRPSRCAISQNKSGPESSGAASRHRQARLQRS